MQVETKTLAELAEHLAQERKRQGLTREQASSISNVSTSFIRDAETNPGKCSLELLLRLTGSLGLTVNISGWQEAAHSAKGDA